MAVHQVIKARQSRYRKGLKKSAVLNALCQIKGGVELDRDPDRAPQT